MRTHRLKTLQSYFTEVWNGVKTFEVRNNDRDFQVGDNLVLVEYEPSPDITIDSRQLGCTVRYVLPGGRFGIDPGYVVMAITIDWKYPDYAKEKA